MSHAIDYGASLKQGTGNEGTVNEEQGISSSCLSPRLLATLGFVIAVKTAKLRRLG